MKSSPHWQDGEFSKDWRKPNGVNSLPMQRLPPPSIDLKREAAFHAARRKEYR
jgi:hypothetical protein